MRHPRRYIDRSYATRRKRTFPRPVVAVMAVLLVGGLAVPVTMANQQSVPTESVQADQPAYWPQKTSAASTERQADAAKAAAESVKQQVAQQQAAAAEQAAKAQQTANEAAAVVASALPSKILDLRRWKIAVPVDTPQKGTPDEIKQPQLAGFSLSPYFYAGKGGVVFQAHAGGFTTKNSSYPRSELREMNLDGTNAAWSNATGVHTMTIRQAITHTPSVKPHVVAGQIHDGSDDVIMVRLEGSHLFVETNGTPLGTLQQGYALGTPFTVKIEAASGQIKVFYNDVLKVTYDRSGTGFFFKAGVYTQSNPSRGESPDAYGQVVIYDLALSHR